MKYSTRDLYTVIILLVFAPIFFIVLYMILTSSVVNINNGLIYLSILCVLYLWVIINTYYGYYVDKYNMILTYPTIFNLYRKKIKLSDVDYYEIVGRNEYSTSDEGLKLRKYNIILKGKFGVTSITFGRESVARNVYLAIKDALMGGCVKETFYIINNKNQS